MEIVVHLEPQNGADLGGGYRDVRSDIYVDNTRGLRLQRKAVIFECLGSMLDYILSETQLDDISEAVCDALDQLDVGSQL